MFQVVFKVRAAVPSRFDWLKLLIILISEILTSLRCDSHLHELQDKSHQNYIEFFTYRVNYFLLFL